MRIAIASGKGGTGKTTLATSLAVALARAGEPVAYVDCDVEEPNGHLFLHPEMTEWRPCTVPVPRVDETLCTVCRACAEACRHSALIVLGEQVVVFPELCHGCGACALACPRDAIGETQRVIGVVDVGRAVDGLECVQGRLDIGEARATPLIRTVRDAAPEDLVVIVDAPPGTSCPVIEAVRGADVVVLVTEPTPFGLNDLALAVDTVRALGLPLGVVVNRVGIGDRAVFEYCEREGLPVLLEVPDDRRVAEAYSRGELIVDVVPGLDGRLVELYRALCKLAGEPRPIRPPLASKSAAVRAPASPPPSEAAPQNGKSQARELVVISGKGGTGKTSIVASFAALSGRSAIADCDVDAADLHLVLSPAVKLQWPFSGGHRAAIDSEACTACGSCLEHCRFDAIVPPRRGEPFVFSVDPLACEGCGACDIVCPSDAVELVPRASGEWFVSETRFGPLVHARLGIAEANSGKLVSLVRREAREVAAFGGRELLLVDGSPGIGCPVIASITGAAYVLVVTEPTPSGLHDLERVVELTRHFGIRTGVCVNKADINPELADRICREAEARGVQVLGRVRYDPQVSHAQVRGVPVVELGGDGAAADIRRLWERVIDALH